MDNAKVIKLKGNIDERGSLVVVQGLEDIPFEIKRIFYIYGTNKDNVRGKHANRNSEFVLINLSGSTDIWVHDGKKEGLYTLNKPDIGLYLPKMTWKNMFNFSEDSILLVLASEIYNPEEYIKDFNEFIKEVNKNG